MGYFFFLMDLKIFLKKNGKKKKKWQKEKTVKNVKMNLIGK